MAVWELAILIFAVTYGMVNMISMVYMVKLMNKYDGIISKALKVCERSLDDMYEELTEDDDEE